MIYKVKHDRNSAKLNSESRGSNMKGLTKLANSTKSNNSNSVSVPDSSGRSSFNPFLSAQVASVADDIVIPSYTPPVSIQLATNNAYNSSKGNKSKQTVVRAVGNSVMVPSMKRGHLPPEIKDLKTVTVDISEYQVVKEKSKKRGNSPSNAKKLSISSLTKAINMKLNMTESKLQQVQAELEQATVRYDKERLLHRKQIKAIAQQIHEKYEEKDVNIESKLGKLVDDAVSKIERVASQRFNFMTQMVEENVSNTIATTVASTVQDITNKENMRKSQEFLRLSQERDAEKARKAIERQRENERQARIRAKEREQDLKYRDEMLQAAAKLQSISVNQPLYKVMTARSRPIADDSTTPVAITKGKNKVDQGCGSDSPEEPVKTRSQPLTIKSSNKVDQGCGSDIPDEPVAVNRPQTVTETVVAANTRIESEVKTEPKMVSKQQKSAVVEKKIAPEASTAPKQTKKVTMAVASNQPVSSVSNAANTSKPTTSKPAPSQTKIASDSDAKRQAAQKTATMSKAVAPKAISTKTSVTTTPPVTSSNTVANDLITIELQPPVSLQEQVADEDVVERTTSHKASHVDYNNQGFGPQYQLVGDHTGLHWELKDSVAADDDSIIYPVRPRGISGGSAVYAHSVNEVIGDKTVLEDDVIEHVYGVGHGLLNEVLVINGVNLSSSFSSQQSISHPNDEQTAPIDENLDLRFHHQQQQHATLFGTDAYEARPSSNNWMSRIVAAEKKFADNKRVEAADATPVPAAANAVDKNLMLLLETVVSTQQETIKGNQALISVMLEKEAREKEQYMQMQHNYHLVDAARAVDSADKDVAPSVAPVTQDNTVLNPVISDANTDVSNAAGAGKNSKQAVEESGESWPAAKVKTDVNTSTSINFPIHPYHNSASPSAAEIASALASALGNVVQATVHNQQAPATYVAPALNASEVSDAVTKGVEEGVRKALAEVKHTIGSNVGVAKEDEHENRDANMPAYKFLINENKPKLDHVLQQRTVESRLKEEIIISKRSVYVNSDSDSDSVSVDSSNEFFDQRRLSLYRSGAATEHAISKQKKVYKMPTPLISNILPHAATAMNVDYNDDLLHISMDSSIDGLSDYTPLKETYAGPPLPSRIKSFHTSGPAASVDSDEWMSVTGSDGEDEESNANISLPTILAVQK